MKKWEIAVEKFLSKWKEKKEVVGAVICGSYITGSPSKHSDLDIQILLDKNVIYRERGNEYVDGFLIEYFANPLPQNEDYYRTDYEDRRNIHIHMFLTGKILFDKNGDVKKMIQIAKKWEKKKYRKPSKLIIELNKYFLWDNLDNLQEKYESNEEDFYFVYYNFLNSLFEKYSLYIRYNKVSEHRIMKALTDYNYKKKYWFKDFPDKEFVNLYVKALKLNDRKIMLNNYIKLTKYVHVQMGGFNIDGWKIRSPALKVKSKK